MASNDIDITEHSDTEKSDISQKTNSDHGEVTPDTRQHRETAKYAEYRCDNLLRNFNRAVSSWRKCATEAERVLSDCAEDITKLRTERNNLYTKINIVSSSYEEFNTYLVSLGRDGEIFERYDSIDKDNYVLAKSLSDSIRKLEASQTDNISICSSHSSHSSRFSTKSREHIAAAAEAASLKVKLQFMDIEAEKRAELEQKKIELEKTQVLRDHDMAQAKLNAIIQIESEEHMDNTEVNVPTINKTDYVTNFLETKSNKDKQSKNSEQRQSTPQRQLNDNNNSNSVPTNVDCYVPNSPNLNVNAKEFVPVLQSNSETVEPHCVSEPLRQECGSSPMNSVQQKPVIQNSINQSNGLESVVKLLTEQVSLSRLPTPEPNIFYGDPLVYPSWKSSFETLIARKCLPECEKVYYLKKYLGGPAKESVEGYLMLSTDDAYMEAIRLLEQRYGGSFVVANAFRDKLDAWPKIGPRDCFALRKLSDFLRQCEMAMKTNPSLCVLNDDRENRKVLMKLPDWLTLRWGRLVAERREAYGDFPLFSEFSRFIAKEARVACDPITSLHSLKPNKPIEPERQSYTNKGLKTRNVGHRSFATESGTESKNWTKCLVCNGSHDTDMCKSFMTKDLQERKNFVIENGLCFGCLRPGHRSKWCKQRLKCQTCFRLHPTSLHGDVRKNSDVQYQKNCCETKPERVSISHMSDSGSSCKCSMIVPVWVSHKDRPAVEVLVYALLDTQSDTTFVLDKTCDKLNIQGVDIKLLLSTMTAENQVVPARRITGLMVRGHNNSQRIMLPVSYTRELMPANRSHIPTPEVARNWSHLSPIADQLMPLSGADVGLLIGYNCSQALAPREVIASLGREPYAQRTDLGWGIVGVVHPTALENSGDVFGVSHRILATSVTEPVSDIQISLQTTIKESINPQDISRMMELDFSERCTDEAAMSHDDLRFLAIMKDGIHLADDHHYEMPLPLVSQDINLPNNRSQAISRLKQLKSRFIRQPTYKNDYVVFMQDIIENGHAEKVPASELRNERSWYIPHHGVYHPKKPNKIRVVFDCSARYCGISLNDTLLQGPNLMNNLIGVLCRFRQETVAFTCDIEQMFFQFRVNSEHQDLLRFLWWEYGNVDCEPSEYRMRVHLFGAVSSPACANFGLRQTANDNEEKFGTDAADFVRQDFYVDDGLRSVASVNEAVKLIKDSQQMCQRGGLRLHKFASNHREVLLSLPPEDRAKEIRELDLSHDDLPIERTLGVHWCIESDTFTFRIVLKDRPLTRRGILSTICSIYDPLGFLAPVLLVGKQILQELCKDCVDWDSPLSENIESRWVQWRNELIELENVNIPRCVKPSEFGEVESIELHHFSDASTSGYGQCSYLRLLDTCGRVHCALLMGKARVTPLKTVTIPRLELTAALISVKVSSVLKQELSYQSVKETFWTDSKIVLGYLSNNTRRFHVFVANRVQQIREQTKPTQWFHVPTDQNPADEASRGVTAHAFLTKSKWLTGPAFLWEQHVPKPHLSEQDLTLQLDDPDVKQTTVHAASSKSVVEGTLLERLEHLSDWHSVKRAVAVCLRLKSRLKQRLVKSSKNDRQPAQYQPCSVEELCQAEMLVIKLVQEAAFAEEIKTLRSRSGFTRGDVAEKRSLKKSSSLYRLDPFLDDNSVLRTGGRMRRADYPDCVKHPVLLPKKHHISKCIIRYFHQQCAHQGRGMTSNAIRANGYWILGARSEVASHIYNCVKCRKMRGPVTQQKMADLPIDRIEPSPPFTFCGVDYFGPWYIKEGRRVLKRYGVIFTCLSSRAIHLETAVSLSTDSFINSLRRFLAVRGPIRQLRSDQGTNFVGASNELKAALSEMDQDRVKRFALSQSCDYFPFKMNVPAASHMGGSWERQIRTVRNVLSSLLDNAGEQLDDESLRTLMYEVMAIVNSRPLTTDNMSDPRYPEPLTPNHLLTMKTKIILPPPGNFVREDIYSRKRWRRVQHLANEFWSRWKREYLQSLQVRQKWIQPRRNLQIGDIVLLKDNDLPRNQWILARVEQTYVSDDGYVRSVKVAVADRRLDKNGQRVHPVAYLERPIQKLVLLLETE